MTSDLVNIVHFSTAALFLLASFAQAAEPPTYWPCPVVGRPGHVAEDGSVHKERTPEDLAAKAVQHCDIVAWGRFVSVCDENYHRTTGVLNAQVTVKFAVEDTLFGEHHEFVRTRLERQMLVWPDTSLNWPAHKAGSWRGRRLREDAAANGREMLKGIYETGAPMTGEQYERLSELFDQTASPQFSVPREEVVVAMSEQVFIGHGGLDFQLEMGAVTPDTLFLVGFSEPVESVQGGEEFHGLSTMLFWGQDAEDVAEQIRIVAGQRGNPRLEERWRSGSGIGDEDGG